MTSERPPNSATFDALWESIDAEEQEDLPPALSAGLPKKGTEERDTLQPPVPAGEYVATMMELGELDDPSESATPRPRPAPSAIPKSPPLTKGLGFVMAPEREVLFDAFERSGIT